MNIYSEMCQKCKKEMHYVLDELKIDVTFFTEFGLKVASKEFLITVTV